LSGKKIAIIDIGSNSIRLVIYLKRHSGAYAELYNFKEVARLSSHINEKQELTEKGIHNLVQTLNRLHKILLFHEADEIIPVATAAIRNASNQIEILQAIKDNNLFDIKVLSGYEEAYYGYLAVVNSTNLDTGITIDIGGGSTEITLFKHGQLLHYHSFPFGAITLKQSFMKGNQLSFVERKELSHYLQEEFQSLPWLHQTNNYPVIGIGGSARNLALIHQRKRNYPLAGLHQYQVPYDDVVMLNNMLQAQTVDERLQIDGLSKDRVDIIIPASEAIRTLMEVTSSPLFIMSNKGLRDGIFLEKLLQERGISGFENVAEENIFQLSKSFNVDRAHVNQVSNIARKLWEQLQPVIIANDAYENDLHLLEYAAQLFSIGEFINKEASSEHTFYLLTNMSIDGVSHDERLAIALISSFKSRSRLIKYWESMQRMMTQEQLNRVEILGAILKLAFNLNRTRKNVIADLSIRILAPKSLLLQLTKKRDETYFEEQYAAKHIKHLERALGWQITLQFITD